MHHMQSYAMRVCTHICMYAYIQAHKPHMIYHNGLMERFMKIYDFLFL